MDVKDKTAEAGNRKTKDQRPLAAQPGRDGAAHQRRQHPHDLRAGHHTGDPNRGQGEIFLEVDEEERKLRGFAQAIDLLRRE